jgi:formyl-CoA transferase
MFKSVTTRDGTDMAVPGIIPKLSRTPGAIRSAAPSIGQNTRAVLKELGLSTEQIAALYERGIVAGDA